MRGQEADGVVAPVVAQPPLEQEAIMDELVDGQQLHRRDAEMNEMCDGRRVCHAGVGSPDSGGMSGWRWVNPLTWTS